MTTRTTQRDTKPPHLVIVAVEAPADATPAVHVVRGALGTLEVGVLVGEGGVEEVDLL